MSHASNAPESTDEKRGGGVSRRTVVRTAAWSAPAVTVAVAAPAHAAVSDILTITNITRSWRGNGENARRLILSLRVNNTSTTDPTALLQVVFTFPAAYGTLSVFQDPVGWTGVASGNTVTFTATTQVPAGGFRLFTDAIIQVQTRPASPPLIQIAATATGFVSGSGTVTPPA